MKFCFDESLKIYNDHWVVSKIAPDAVKPSSFMEPRVLAPLASYREGRFPLIVGNKSIESCLKFKLRRC